MGGGEVGGGGGRPTDPRAEGGADPTRPAPFVSVVVKTKLIGTRKHHLLPIALPMDDLAGGLWAKCPGLKNGELEVILRILHLLSPAHIRKMCSESLVSASRISHVDLPASPNSPSSVCRSDIPLVLFGVSDEVNTAELGKSIPPGGMSSVLILSEKQAIADGDILRFAELFALVATLDESLNDQLIGTTVKLNPGGSLSVREADFEFAGILAAGLIPIDFVEPVRFLRVVRVHMFLAILNPVDTAKEPGVRLRVEIRKRDNERTIEMILFRRVVVPANPLVRRCDKNVQGLIVVVTSGAVELVIRRIGDAEHLAE